MLLILNNVFFFVLYIFFFEYSLNLFIGYNDKILYEVEEFEILFLIVIKILIWFVFEMFNSCVFCEVILFV